VADARWGTSSKKIEIPYLRRGKTQQLRPMTRVITGKRRGGETGCARGLQLRQVIDGQALQNVVEGQRVMNQTVLWQRWKERAK